MAVALPAGLTPFTIEGFQGLRLDLDAEEVGPSAALDALNADLDRRGRVRSRDGYAAFTSSALAQRPTSLSPYYKASGTRQVVAGSSTRLDALSTAGAIVASKTGLVGGGSTAPFATARVGGPGFEYLYASSINDRAVKWDGTTWATASAIVDGAGGQLMPAGGALAVQQPDNRLVVGNFVSGSDGPQLAATNPSRIYFSAPGDPETWTTSDWVDLSPGDGESITAMVQWGTLLFVFKPSSFYVFYGNTEDSTGGAVFNFRPVSAGVGCVSPRGVAVARDGVYFLDRKGLYKTTGSDPVLVSDAISPLFRGITPSFYTGSPINQAQMTLPALTVHLERVFMAVPTGSSTTNDRLFVFNPATGDWLPWSTGASCLASFRANQDASLVFGYATGANHVGIFDTSTTDAGTSITSLYRSGFFDLGSPAREKTVRETELTGAGTVGLAWAADLESMGSSHDVSMSNRGLHRYAAAGELLSYQLSSSAQWLVSSLRPMLRETRGAGEMTS